MRRCLAPEMFADMDNDRLAVVDDGAAVSFAAERDGGKVDGHDNSYRKSVLSRTWYPWPVLSFFQCRRRFISILRSISDLMLVPRLRARRIRIMTTSAISSAAFGLASSIESARSNSAISSFALTAMRILLVAA